MDVLTHGRPKLDTIDIGSFQKGYLQLARNLFVGLKFRFLNSFPHLIVTRSATINPDTHLLDILVLFLCIKHEHSLAFNHCIDNRGVLVALIKRDGTGGVSQIDHGRTSSFRSKRGA